MLRSTLGLMGKMGKLVWTAGGATLAGLRLLSRGYGALVEGGADSISFRDRVVFITGGSRGLGLVLARRFVAEGARVALMARDPAELDRALFDLSARSELATRSEQASRGDTVLALAGDVADRAAVEQAVAETVRRLGGIDVLCNNAGIIQTGPYQHMDLADFAQAMDVHFWGPLYTMRAALPYLRRRPGGRIVNIASIGGKLAVPHLLPYCASKFALAGLSSGLGAELRREGIRVTTVYPGLMRTGSPPNALFKGDHDKEYLWFAVSDSLPLITVSAEDAADQILAACRRGDAELVIGRPYRLAARLGPLLPRLTAAGMAAANWLLPRPTDRSGDVAQTGWASSGLTPSILTYLTRRAAQANNEVPRPA